MSDQEQAPYFDQAHKERRAHEAKYPGWSPKDNVGKKAKRRKADKIPVPPNHHHFAFPVAPANQQTIIINGIPVQPIPLEAFLNQLRQNEVPIEVLP